MLNNIKNFLKKNNKKNNFNNSIKVIKKLVAKSEFDLAYFWLDEILRKETDFFNKWDVLNLKNKKKFQLKSDKINSLKEYITFLKDKIEINSTINLINTSFKENNYLTIKDNLNYLKNKFIDNKKDFKYLNKYYLKNLKKIEYIEWLSNLWQVDNFKDVILKFNALLWLWMYDLLEKWISEIKQKETNIIDLLKNEEFSRKKILKAEKEYNKKILLLDNIEKKIFVLKNKQIQINKKKEMQSLLKNTKLELENLVKKEDLYITKEYIEKKISDNNYRDLNIVWFLNKKLNEVSIKIRKNELLKNKKENSIEEVKGLLKSIWENSNLDLVDIDSKIKNKQFIEIFNNIKKYLNKLYYFFDKRTHNRVLDELNSILIDTKIELNENELDNKDLIEKYHFWMTKILSWTKINGYDFYWKVLWADKITGDTFVFHEKNDRYWFSIWDATWHWLRAWLIVSKFTKLFSDMVNSFDKLDIFSMELNNNLKSSLKSWNFLTCLLFEIEKKSPSNLKIIWMWHEPIYIYRKQKKIVEEYRFIWLAWWIRKITNLSSVKINDFHIDDWDILVSYTDWIIEAKSKFWEMYWLNRFKEKFLSISNQTWDLKKIYDFLITDLKTFSWKVNYDDDVTIILFSRNTKTDLVNDEEILSIIKNSEYKINDWDINFKKIKWKTKESILEELNNIRLKRELNVVIQKLTELYKDWEILKLKEEAIKYIKQWYVSSKINNLLKKSIKMEELYKVNIRNKKLEIKYKTLVSLYNKGDYKTVIKDAYDVVLKNGNI